jgi:hypothetical protein
MSYFIVRVNTPEHFNLSLAMTDMAYIIEKGGYWKKSSRPDMPIGSPIVAVGSHGGRGLLLHGIVRKGWKSVKGGAEGNPVYQHKLGVLWDNRVYMHAPEGADLALRLAGVQGNPLPILRAHTTMDQAHYRAVLDMVLLGESVNPWEYNQEEAAA